MAAMNNLNVPGAFALKANRRCACCNNPWSQGHTAADAKEGDAAAAEKIEYDVLACSNCGGLDAANLDNEVKPTDNFYLYGVGGWKKNNEIPAEYPSWNTFLELHELNMARVKAIVEGLGQSDEKAEEKAEEDEKNPTERKLTDFWLSANDEETIEARGIEPLLPVLALADAVADAPPGSAERSEALGAFFAQVGTTALFNIDEGADSKESQMTRCVLTQSGLGLPDRDYYFDDDKEEKRAAYVAHLQRSLDKISSFTGLEPGDATAAAAEQIMSLELELAASHLTRTQRRDPELRYNPFTQEELAEQCPGLLWPEFFAAVGKPDPGPKIIVDCPAALALACKILGSQDEGRLRPYMWWRVIRSLSAHLPAAFVEDDFDFFSKTLSGTKELKPRWKRALSMTESALGEALAEKYVKLHFTSEAKEKALAIVERVRVALEEKLANVEWLAPETRVAAVTKMQSFGLKIGYPDEFVDYSSLEVVRGEHVENVLRARAFEWQRTLKWMNAPTDRSRWLMLPQTVNAYHYPEMNEIVFPAAILQPPFFNIDADDAVNYAAMGAVTGHEMTHAFDDKGRKYDANGNLTNWWTEADAKEYDSRSAVVVKQAEEFKVHDVALNGKLTCGENTADLGGLKLAYAALTALYEEKGEALSGPDAPLIQGFTPQQRFFLSWAQVWRDNVTKERALQMVTLDPHGPHELRTNGPLSNMPEFYEAFNVQEGDPMWRPENERANIW